MKSISHKAFSNLFGKYIGVNNAPFENSGYIYRNKTNRGISRLAVTLDLCVNSVTKAIKARADALLCFHSPDSLDICQKDQRLILRQIKNRLSVYKCHLPLNFSENGLHAKLCEISGLRGKPITFLYNGELVHGGFYKVIGKYTLAQLLSRLKRLGGGYARVYNERGSRHQYRNILVSSGSGFKKEIMDQVPCEMIISGEIKHGMIVKARDMGLTLLELGHYVSENQPLSLVAEELEKYLGIKVLFIDVPLHERLYGFR